MPSLTHAQKTISFFRSCGEALSTRLLRARAALSAATIFVFLAVSFVVAPPLPGSVSPAAASVSCPAGSTYSLTNGRIGFGGSNHQNTGTFNYASSVESNGILKQPFYKSGSTWYKLTYSSRSLEFALGHGASGAAWPTSNVLHITSAYSAPVIDASGFITQGVSGSVCYGYGTLKTSTVVTINASKRVTVEQSFILGQNDSFVQIQTKVINNQTAGALTNVQIWVGTGDDYVGVNDSVRKTRGNLVDGAFQAITATTQASSALLIESGAEGVLFYSTTANTSTTHDGCCDFANAYNQNPATNPITRTGDGSYALFLPVGDLADGASSEITWFYAAGATADLATVAQAVAAAGAPAVPAATPANASADLTWVAPSSSDPITGYRIEVTKDGVVQSPTIDLASTALSSTVTGLVNGSSYTFKVAALTGASRDTVGTFSGSSLAVIPGAPSAPSISSVTVGNQKLTVAFTAPTATGGFPITAYEYSTDNGATWVAATGTSSPIVITGLTNGTTYQVKLRGKNASHSGIASSASPGTPASSRPDAPTINSITTASQALTVAFTPPADNGGASISRYEYSTDNGATWRRLSPDVTASPFLIDKLSSDGTTALVNGVAYAVSIRGVNSNGNSAGATTVTATPAIPVAASSSSSGPVVPPAVVIPPRALPRVLPVPPPVVGPVVQNGGGGLLPPSQPTALVGGRPLEIQTQMTDPNTMSLRAGLLNIGMNVPSNQGGGVSQQGSSTEIQVRNGGVASVNGSGLLPRSTVQVFMPLGGSNSREIARIPVDANGSFSGDAIFGATPAEAPLPIGRHVLQVVTVDENRQQTVVEMTVNIAQPPPAPELNRSTNERPTLFPGQSIATNGGQPEPVVVTPIPDQKQATIEGDGWSMAVSVEGDGGGVSSGEGGAEVTFVRDQSAVVSGEGFMPGTRADVWLFSDPTLLGTVDIDANGEFNGVVNIDGNVVTVGEHTLQLQGVGADGLVRAANLGVNVMDEAQASTAESSGSLFWLWMLVLLGVVSVAAAGTWMVRRARGAVQDSPLRPKVIRY
jgi:hypothetical protein